MILLFFGGDIHSLFVPIIGGRPVALAEFKGKKMLFLNIATGSNGMNQIAALDSLQEKFRDQLQIIAIPSNSFGKQSLPDAEIKELLKGSYHIHFLLGETSDVSGSHICPIYKWLTRKEENGLADLPVSENFQKFLVSGEGKIVGIFGGSITPMSETIQQAVAAKY